MFFTRLKSHGQSDPGAPPRSLISPSLELWAGLDQVERRHTLQENRANGADIESTLFEQIRDTFA